jgi:hypothetical protein
MKGRAKKGQKTAECPAEKKEATSDSFVAKTPTTVRKDRAHQSNATGDASIDRATLTMAHSATYRSFYRETGSAD